jgi:hypothetical protein
MYIDENDWQEIKNYEDYTNWINSQSDQIECFTNYGVFLIYIFGTLDPITN